MNTLINMNDLPERCQRCGKNEAAKIATPLLDNGIVFTDYRPTRTCPSCAGGSFEWTIHCPVCGDGRGRVPTVIEPPSFLVCQSCHDDIMYKQHTAAGLA